MVDQEVSRVSDSDLAAAADFTDWVASRSSSLQRFAYLVSGSASEAPDLVQDALIRAYPRWASLVKAGTAEAYIRRSIVNGSISGWRKRRRLVRLPDALTQTATDLDPAVTTSEADEAWRLCLTLPATQRAAVVLRFYEDLSFAQIALILDCSESTARSHVHRAIRALRDRLAESETTHD